MKKQHVSYLFSGVAVSLPILACLFYVAGLTYHHACLHVFGISYGLFEINFHDTLFFGGEVVAMTTIKYLDYFCFIVGAISFVVILYSWIFYKLQSLNIVISLEKKLNAKSDWKILNKNASFLKSCLVVLIIVFVFYCVMGTFIWIIDDAAKKGKVLGNNLKQEYLKNFSKIDHKMDLSESGLLVIKIRKVSKNMIGYVLASNDRLLALYTKDNGLEIVNYSDVIGITRYK